MIKILSEELPKILQITPPFIMIDYAFDVKPGESASSIKELKDNDWFFDCHLKKEQAMPGTLQIEALLQTLVLSIYTLNEFKGKLAFVINIKSKLFKKVSPNSVLIIETKIISNKRGIVIGKGTGKVGESLVCQGEFHLIVPESLPQVKIA